MICFYCNRVIPDESTECIYCKSKIDPSVKRCPDCWARLEDGQDICHKCGCNVEKRLEEIHKASKYKAPTFLDKIRKIPLWIKIAIPLVLIIVTMGIAVYDIVSEKEMQKEAVRLAGDYVVAMEITMDDITELAYAYENMVYDQSWLDHLGSATAVRDVYKTDISVAKKAREPLNYFRKQIAGCGNEEISKASNDLYRSYTVCYGYVIGEEGTYPEYIAGYNKLLKEYKKSVKELKKIIEKYE